MKVKKLRLKKKVKNLLYIFIFIFILYISYKYIVPDFVIRERQKEYNNCLNYKNNYKAPIDCKR